MAYRKKYVKAIAKAYEQHMEHVGNPPISYRMGWKEYGELTSVDEELAVALAKKIQEMKDEEFASPFLRRE